MGGDDVAPAEAPRRVSYDGSPVLTGVVRWMQEGVVLHDPDGHIVEASPSACELLGVPEAHLIGISDPDVFGDQPIQAGWRLIDLDGRLFPPERNPSAITARTGEPATAVMGVHRPDGSRVWLSVSSVPLPVEGEDRPMVLATFVDVTDRVEARNRLVESEERFRLTLRHAPIGMATVALDGTYLSVNPRLAEMLGRGSDDLEGMTFAEVTHPDDLEADLNLSELLLEGRIDGFELDKRFISGDGAVVWGHLAVALVRDAEGSPLHFVSQVEDITESRRTKEQLEERVLYDPLTGLANRVLTADRTHQAVSRQRDTGRSVAVLCCGIDGLKRVNDSLGHAAGDALIAAVGERVVQVVGSADRIGRGNGDEFFVLVDDLEGPDVPIGLIDRILAAVAEPLEVFGHELRPAVSVGVAITTDGHGGDDLLHDATTALYAAKGGSRGEWVLFDRSIRARAVRRLRVESELGPAIANHEFELYYQPIVELESRRTVGYEALARWHHPRHGLLLPAAFVPVAEETGLISELGAHVLDQACAFLRSDPDGHAQVFVNVSPSQLSRESFPELVRAALDRHGVPAARLGIELTESSVLHATGSSYRALQELAEIGIDLVLDDFGTGYSAVAALLASPIRGIKLDRSFTSRLGVDPQADLVTRALGGMVEALGFRGVAEGVETEAQCAAVQGHGWKYGQGWLFGRPEPMGLPSDAGEG